MPLCGRSGRLPFTSSDKTFARDVTNGLFSYSFKISPLATHLTVKSQHGEKKLNGKRLNEPGGVQRT